MRTARTCEASAAAGNVLVVLSVFRSCGRGGRAGELRARLWAAPLQPRPPRGGQSCGRARGRRRPRAPWGRAEPRPYPPSSARPWAPGLRAGPGRAAAKCRASGGGEGESAGPALLWAGRVLQSVPSGTRSLGLSPLPDERSVNGLGTRARCRVRGGHGRRCGHRCGPALPRRASGVCAGRVLGWERPRAAGKEARSENAKTMTQGIIKCYLRNSLMRLLEPLT